MDVKDKSLQLFYNHAIHPELIRMERRRRRLVRLLLGSGLLIFALFIFQLYLGIAALALFIMIPVAFYGVQLYLSVKRFVKTYKPAIVKQILSYIQTRPNVGELHYDPEKSIGKSEFKASGLFEGKFDYYEGEDYIAGKIGEMPFELCELSVREVSSVANQLRVVFQGIYVLATFNEETSGSVRVWPRRQRQHLTRAMKNFAWKEGKDVADEIESVKFRDNFIVYATEETVVHDVLTKPMQDALYEYYKKTGHDLYIAFEDRKIYAALGTSEDLLEPEIFYSNLGFDHVKKHYDDIWQVLEIVRVFDQMH